MRQLRSALVPLVASLVLLSTVGGARAADTENRSGPAGKRPGPRHAADLALVGVIQRDDGDPLAVIEDRTRKTQALYRLGSLVAGGRLTRILPDKVTLVFTDDEIELRLAGTAAPGAPTSKPTGPAVVLPVPPQPPDVSPSQEAPAHSGMQRLDRAALDHFLRMPDVVTHVTPVEGRGVRVGEVRQATMFEALGLRKGDLIRNVNGRIPTTSAALGKAIEQAADGGLVRIEVERAGAMDVKYIQVQP